MMQLNFETNLYRVDSFIGVQTANGDTRTQ